MTSFPAKGGSSTNEPRHLPNQTPMTPSMEDAPKPQNKRVRIEGIQESGAKIGKRNLTGLGHAVRAGSTVRDRSAARVVGGARAGKGPRAVGVIRQRCTAGTRMGNPESGHPNVGRRNPAGSLATT